MAVSYLQGNEFPSAAAMNELWAEADSIIDKALNGGSTYLLEDIGASASASSHPDSYLYRGTPFAWTTLGTHTASSTSVLYSAFETVPTHHSQSSYDTAADGATVSSYSSDGYAHLAGSSTPNLINSLKVHTRTNSGQEYHIWEYDQPAPEKQWKFGTCEIILALGSGTSFAVPDDYLKYNCWRIHNLTDRTYTIYLDDFSSPADTFTIPPYNQRCVRRITPATSTNPGEYDFSYKYFFKVEPDDPRFLFFDSFDGSIAQTMRANNITNPHYIFNLFEFVGMGNDPILNSTAMGDSHHQRIYFNATTQNNIGAEYATAGHFPAITDSTKIGDIVYHKGKVAYRKKDTSGSTLEQGTINFDGWGTFNSNLNAIDVEIDTSGITHNKDTAIARTGSPSLLEIWPLSTNVLQINDVNQVLNLAASSYRLQTHFLEVPDIHQHGVTIGVDYAGRPKSFREYHAIWNTIATSGATPNLSGTGYDGRTYTVGNLKSQIGSYCSISTPENKSVVITTEGPKLLWRDVFGIKSDLSGGDNPGHWGGFMTNHAFTLELDGSTLKLKCDQEWHIAKRLHIAGYSGGSAKGAANYLYAYLCGWPTLWKDSMINAVSSNRRHHIDTHKFHRIHETPREGRKYETATPITAGTETFKHNDFIHDPKEGDATGSDVTQTGIGDLTETDIAFLTNDIDAKVSKGSFSGGEINNPNYPRLVIDDVMLEAEESKTDTSLNTIKTPASYNRINLVKEHYNNIAVMLKRADKIRPLCVDEIYWGNRTMQPGTGWFGAAGSQVAPINLFEGFVDGDSQDALYTDLLGASKVYDYTDFADGTAIHSAASTTGSPSEQDDLEDFRWVKIEDVKAFADAEGLGFRFEELAVPCRWVTSLSQTHWLGSLADQEDCFLVAVSGEGHAYKSDFQGGVQGMVAGENFGINFDYTPLTTSASETLGETFFREDLYNYLFPNQRLIPVFKDNLGNSGNAYGYATGLVIQIIDGTSGRTNTPRGKLALQPLKTVKVYNAGNTSLAAGVEIDIDDSDRVETATTELESITSDKHFYYPTKPRHRYAYLLLTSAAKTHSA